MKRLALAIGLAAVVAVMGLSTALAATEISAGNTISDRLHSDSWGKSYLVDTGTHFTQDGRVDQWEIWAENTNKVQLVIYRHTGDEMDEGWSEVGRDTTIRTPGVGKNTFDIATPIGVEEGDFIGLYFPDDDGSVSFSLSPSNAPFQRGNFTGRVLFTAEGGSSSTAFVDSSNRIYSLRATGDALEDDDSDDDADDEDISNRGEKKAKGNSRNFGTHLSGDEADTDSQAQGQANFKLSKDGDSLKYKLNVANIEDVAFAGLYREQDGDDALLATLFDENLEGRFQGTLAEGELTDDDVVDDLDDLIDDIREGKVYVAVSTGEGNGDIEILGWLASRGNGGDSDEDSNSSSVSDDDEDEDEDEDDEEEDSEHLRGWEKNDKEMKEKKDKKDE